MKLVEKAFLIALFIFGNLGNLFAQTRIVNLRDDSLDYMSIGKNLMLFEDPKHTYDFATILKSDSLFKPSKLDAPNFGTTASAVWFMLDLKLQSNTPWFLELDAPWLDTVMIFYPNHGKYELKYIGRRFSIKHQEEKTPDLIYKISAEEFPKDTVLRFYFRANGKVVVLPLFIGQSDEVIRHEYNRELYFIFYCGIAFSLVIFYLAVFITSRKLENLYYISWITVTTYYFSATKGYLKLVLPDSLNFLLFRSVEPVVIAGLLLLLFTSTSLHIKQVLPSFNKWFRLLLGAMIILLFLCVIGQSQLALKVFEPLMLLTMVMSLIAGIKVYRKGYSYALYYTLAFAQTLVSVGVYILVFMKVFPFNDFTSNISLIGTNIEIVLLSLGLGAKIRDIEREKQKAQESVVLALQDNEKIINYQNEILEIKVNERTQLLEIEKRKTEDLLRNILPDETAEELKKNGHSKPKTYDSVTVMFTDFIGYTGISEKIKPEQLVEEIDYCFSAFDGIIGKYNIEKIKTIGDSYMCAAGLPTVTNTHATDMLNAAIEIKEFINKRKLEKESGDGVYFEIRIGINSGPLVAGIVGVKKFAYDIWGDTVNTASRMEQNSESGKINISGSTYALVKDNFECIYRGKMEVKGKGFVDMYFVSRSFSEG